MIRELKNGLLDWLFQWRGPVRGSILLVQRRVFILPTGYGMVFAGVILLMLLGSVNYDLSLGFILSFLLGAAGIQSILHTFRNIAHLRISPGRVSPVFAGETTQFHLNISNKTRAHRYSIGVTADSRRADYVDVAAGADVTAVVPIPAERRGWLRPGRLTLFTRFPTGLFRAWSYADLDMRCLVYPAPAATNLALPPPVAGDGTGGVHGQGQDEFAGLRTYRPGDSPRHIAWKAVARDNTLLTKQFTGRANAEMWLDWNQLPAAMDVEQKLSHLARWVIDTEEQHAAFGLKLPGKIIKPASGSAHCAECLTALALYGTTADNP